MLLPTVFRVLNGLLTISFLPFLYSIYKKERKVFYLLWGSGFFLYGVNNLVRAALLYSQTYMVTAELAAFLIQSSGLILILTGIGNLIGRTRLMFLSSLSIPILMVVFYLTTKPYELAQLVALFPYFFVCASLLFIRFRFRVELDMFVIGWVMIFLINVGYMFGYTDSIFTDIFTMIGKIVIFYGMTGPRFTFLASDFESFLISGSYSSYNENHGGYLTFIESRSKRNVEIIWIKEKVLNNSLSGVRTVLVTVYDTISPHDLKREGVLDTENLYLIRMVNKEHNVGQTFSEKIMNIGDDVSDLEILFSDIFELAMDRKFSCQIILYNISILIHVHGWRRLYSFLISSIHRMKASNVKLYIIYYPKTHSNYHEIGAIEQLADQIIQI